MEKMTRVFLLLVGFVFISGSSMAAPIACKGGEWNFVTNSSHKTATLYYKGKIAPFGNMQCLDTFSRVLREEGRPILSCWSARVADAGFSVLVYQPEGQFDPIGKLHEISFIGSRFVTNMKCVRALH